MADLVYEYRHLLSLQRQVDAVLARGGRALCADPYRPTGADFFARLRRRYRVTAVDESVHFEGRRVPVRLVWIRPS